MAILSVREARKILAQKRKNLRLITAKYDRTLKLVRKLHDQQLAAEKTARGIADEMEDAERWVSLATTAVEEARRAPRKRTKRS